MKVTMLACVPAILLCALLHAAQEEPAPQRNEKLAAERAKWSGNLNFGWTQTSGNTDSTSLSISAAAARKTEKNLLEASGQLLYGETDGNETTNKGESLVRFSYFHTKKFFSYCEGGAYYDEFRNLDVGIRLAAGVGRKFLDTEKTRLSGRFGIAWTMEDYGIGMEDEDYTSATAGLDYSRNLSDNLLFTFQVSVDQDLAESENWILNAEAALKSKLSGRISLIVSAADRYDNDPPPGVRENDLILITALGIAF